MVTTQGEMVEAKLLPRNGPSGWYSQAWMSRADQSLNSTTPKICSRAFDSGTGLPCALPGPMTKPSSSSKSRRLLGPNIGAGASGALVWPDGRTTGVRLTTIEDARPW